MDIPMKYFANVNWEAPKEAPGAVNYPIFNDGEAPCVGCNASVNRYYSEEYPSPAGVHEDNEGFYVVKGCGMSKIGDEETEIKEGTFFYAPAGVEHVIKKSPECESLEVVLFHFPVTE